MPFYVGLDVSQKMPSGGVHPIALGKRPKFRFWRTPDFVLRLNMAARADFPNVRGGW
jgi:hypothetical protein